MAKKEEKYKYPSQFGSHVGMVNSEETEKLGLTNPANVGKIVVCTDEYGDYQTKIENLDSGQVDWNRADGNRVKIDKQKKG